MNDGTELEGNIKKLKRAKWLFEEIHLIVDGDKKKISAEDIKSMYLPQSGLDKINKVIGDAYNSTTWHGTEDMNQERLKDGYAYFESTDCYYKKKKHKVLLLQLLNPAFANQVKVFHDPGAKEGGGFSVGGIGLTDDYDKSYYIKINNNIAYKLKKKDYKKQAGEIFGECPDFYSSIENDLKWKKIGETLFNYSQSCF